MDVKKAIKTPLSNFDLQKLVSDLDQYNNETNNVNIFTPEEMLKDPNKFMNNLNEERYCILFINPKNLNMGHWVVIYKAYPSNKIYFFDSYGGFPKENDPKLHKFLLKYIPNIKINTFQYQRWDSQVATCGRYAIFVGVGLNNLFKNLTLEKINQIFKGLNKKLGNKGYDYVVSNFVRKGLK